MVFVVHEAKDKSYSSATTMSGLQEALHVCQSIQEHCQTYNIPKENLLDILEDQKVLPMIRGKATEYIGAAILRQSLDRRDWSVDKLNLNPQPGMPDEDLSITYRRTGRRLKAETKNAVRGSFRLGTRINPREHFKVKCHKLRSHMTKATNDRYLVGEFDILLCNISNSIFRSKALDRGLPLIEDDKAVEWLKTYYGGTPDDELRRYAYDDWRMCLPTTIADENGIIPRTPSVQIIGNPNWFGLEQLAIKLRTLIN